MKKNYCNAERFDGIKKIGNTYIVTYGFGEDEQGKYHFEELFSHEPTLDYIKFLVLEQINTNTQQQITSGFKWKDMLVWLSEANQLNYARDFAVAYCCEKSGEHYSLPTYKFGTDDEPTYYTFENFEEFKQFSKAWALHISETLRAGWYEKSIIDWTGYSI